MKDVLDFVRGAVASSENITPVLSRFCITGGRIQGANGRIAIDAPCKELDSIDVLVDADRFLRAVDACKGEPRISTTDKGQLLLDTGGKGFKARLPTQPVDMFPRAGPTEGKRQKLGKKFLTLLRQLKPFVGEDSTRIWCLTLFSNGDRAYATNSNMIASAPAGGIKIQLPIFAVNELLRIEAHPDAYTMDDNSVTFFYGDAWLKSQLIVGEWPHVTAQEVLSWKTKLKALPATLIADIESIVPFCLDPKSPEIHFTADGVSTTPGETQAEVEGAGWPPVAFDARNLLPMLRAATHFHIDAETSRGLFEGDDGFRGAMRGRKT